MKDQSEENQENPSITLPGKVQKILKPSTYEPERAEISVEGAEHLYKEIRIENALENGEGEKVKLKPGEEVIVTIEAPIHAVEKKSA